MMRALVFGLVLACSATPENDTSGPKDADGDGVIGTADCNSADALMSPFAEDLVGDGIDQDCDGVDGTDADGDGFASVATGGPDCADDDPLAHPGVIDECNGRDDDCNGVVDDGPRPLWSVDVDGDGVGDAAVTLYACEQPPGYVGPTNDCDDSDPRAFPGNEEVCDGVDNDCDSLVDGPGVPGWTVWWADSDGDGYGRDDDEIWSCMGSQGLAPEPGDCDDAEALVHPGALEVCNLVDDDCNGVVDGADALGAQPWHPDADQDGWGDENVEVVTCAQPPGYTGDDSDCDDSDPSIGPGQPDAPADGIDSDCDGLDI
jgi:hypothetical protein